MSRFARAFLPLAVIAVAATFACDNQQRDTATLRRTTRMEAASPYSTRADSASFGDEPRKAFGAVGGARTAERRALPVAAPDSGGAEAQTPTTPPEVVPGSMLIRVGEASLQVDSLDIGIQRIREVARRTNSVIANTSMAGGREQTRSASLELRIPSDRFDEAVNGLSPIGKLDSINVTAQDVGEEFVDVQARVANARRLEQRLVELLASRTGKLSDVLNVERELARVREQIERYEGRMRYLRARSSISTLTVAVHEPFPIVADHPGARPMRDAFVQAWKNLVGFTAGIIVSLGVLIPLGIIFGALILLGRRFFPTLRLSPNTPSNKSS